MADTGCGIAVQDIEKLFDPFFSNKFTGRGMGLAVVLGIVRGQGGAVTVESEPGRGSIFLVFLPLSDEEVSRHPDKVAPVPEITIGGTVLLVDDEETMHNMATALLTRLGYTVLAAKDGVEAVEVFRMITFSIEWEATFKALTDQVSIHDNHFRIVKINGKGPSAVCGYLIEIN